MKFKTTKKAIKENYYYIIGAGYCKLDEILLYENATAFSARHEGWACDYYEIDNVCISTGYDAIDSKHTSKIDYKAMQKYNDNARKINKSNLDDAEKKAQVQKLLREFVENAKEV